MSLLVEIRKNFGSFRLDVSFETRDGVLGLLGASGCGKSMTLRCIAGIVRPDAGRIVLDGKVLFDKEKGIDLPPQKRGVGLLFQNYALFPHMTVGENLRAGMTGSRKEKEEQLTALVERLGLQGLERRRPAQLSGGQQQRVALGRILAAKPGVLLLDEPLSALDSYLRWQVELELLDTLKAFDGPVVLVTHSRDEVARLCRDVCVLDRGRSEEMRTVSQLLHAPDTVASCLLSGCKNLSRASVCPDGRVEALDWGVTLTCDRPLPGGLTHVAIHARDLRLVQSTGENVLPCRCGGVLDQGEKPILLMDLPGGGRLRVDGARPVPSEGHPCLLHLPPQRLLLLTGGNANISC